MLYILIWKINKSILPHYLYSGANHLPLFYCSCWRPFYCDQTNTIDGQEQEEKKCGYVIPTCYSFRGDYNCNFRNPGPKCPAPISVKYSFDWFVRSITLNSCIF